MEPLFDVDTRNDDILWEFWIDGFDTALQLRPEAWAKVLGSDEDSHNALAGLVALVQIGRGESTLPKEHVDDLTAKAPDLIPRYIETLNAWRISQHVAGQRRTEAPNFGKVGRNEPCPCGSGKEIQAMLWSQLTTAINCRERGASPPRFDFQNRCRHRRQGGRASPIFLGHRYR